VSERGTVALMPTCLVDLVRPEAGVAAVRVLRRAGYRVTFPEGQTCCGQPAWNSGFPDEARRVAATTLAALAESEGPIVVLSGSCAATMLHAWHELFAGDARLAGVLERVIEFGAFLAPLASTASAIGARRSVAFHCSCHQRRGLRDTTSGTTLISSLPGVELVTHADADACCGFGGTFAIKFPGVSTAMGRDKVNAVGEAGASELVSGDLGCLVHLAGVAAEHQVALATTTLPELLEREGWTP
jgi:L-lactate dehydrogenase complex protein LldE